MKKRREGEVKGMRHEHGGIWRTMHCRLWGGGGDSNPLPPSTHYLAGEGKEGRERRRREVKERKGAEREGDGEGGKGMDGGKG